MVRACDLKQKEVINILDAQILGYICDVDIDFDTGRIRSVIIPSRRRLFNLFKKKEYIIPWEEIYAVGKEVVLVKCELCEAVK